jgi:phage terminase large subunit-like protein
MAARSRKSVQEDDVVKRDYASIAQHYAEEVVGGRVIACKYVRLACMRHLNDLKRVPDDTFEYRFSAKKAARICAFGEELPHVKGKWAKKSELIVWQPWQVFILCCLFGWVHKTTGLRKYRKAYIEIPRKNGKSVLAAVIGLFMLCMDGEFGAEVYSGATTEKQAWEVFRPAKLMFNSPEAADLRDYCGGEVWAKALNTTNGSRFEPIIGKPGDGASPSCSIADEFHEHDTPDQVDTMETGMGAREQPLSLKITTAGVNLAGPCYDTRADAIKVLEGVFDDPETYAIIFSIDLPEFEGDKGDDWMDPAVLAKANPNMGVSVDEGFLKAQQRQAVLNPIHQNRFKTKHLNVWCSAKLAWMPLQLWKLAGDSKLKLEDMVGKPCLLVLDLASKDDIAALKLLFWEDVGSVRHYWEFSRYYIPEDSLFDEENTNAAMYRKWHEQGYLTATEGAEIDFTVITDDVLRYGAQFSPQELVFDPWRATQLAQVVRTKASITTVEMPQQVKTLSGPMKEMLSAVRASRYHHNNNPVTNWMVSNVTAKTDAKDNIYPNKEKRHLKIDGAVAAIMGMARAMTPPENGDINDWLSGGPVVAVAPKPVAKVGAR